MSVRSLLNKHGKLEANGNLVPPNTRGKMTSSNSRYTKRHMMQAPTRKTNRKSTRMRKGMNRVSSRLSDVSISSRQSTGSRGSATITDADSSSLGNLFTSSSFTMPFSRRKHTSKRKKKAQTGRSLTDKFFRTLRPSFSFAEEFIEHIPQEPKPEVDAGLDSVLMRYSAELSPAELIPTPRSRSKSKIRRPLSMNYTKNNGSERNLSVVSSTPMSVINDKKKMENRSIKSRRMESSQSSTYEEVDPVSQASFGRLTPRQLKIRMELNKEFTKMSKKCSDGKNPKSLKTSTKADNTNNKVSFNEAEVGARKTSKSFRLRKRLPSDGQVSEDGANSDSSFDDIQQLTTSELISRLKMDIDSATKSDALDQDETLKRELHETLSELQAFGETEESELLRMDLIKLNGGADDQQELIRKKIQARVDKEKARQLMLKTAMHNSFNQKQIFRKENEKSEALKKFQENEFDKEFFHNKKILASKRKSRGLHLSLGVSLPSMSTIRRKSKLKRKKSASAIGRRKSAVDESEIQIKRLEDVRDKLRISKNLESPINPPKPTNLPKETPELPPRKVRVDTSQQKETDEGSSGKKLFKATSSKELAKLKAERIKRQIEKRPSLAVKSAVSVNAETAGSGDSGGADGSETRRPRRKKSARRSYAVKRDQIRSRRALNKASKFNLSDPTLSLGEESPKEETSVPVPSAPPPYRRRSKKRLHRQRTVNRRRRRQPRVKNPDGEDDDEPLDEDTKAEIERLKREIEQRKLQVNSLSHFVQRRSAKSNSYGDDARSAREDSLVSDNDEPRTASNQPSHHQQQQQWDIARKKSSGQRSLEPQSVHNNSDSEDSFVRVGDLDKISVDDDDVGGVASVGVGVEEKRPKSILKESGFYFTTDRRSTASSEELGRVRGCSDLSVVSETIQGADLARSGIGARERIAFLLELDE